MDASNWITVTPGTTAGYNLLSATLLEKYTSPTVVRIVGRVQIAPNPFPELADSTVYSWGIITTPDITITTSDYDPLNTTLERDWMMLKFGGHYYTSNSNEDLQMFDLDISTRRKLDKSRDLSFYITNSILSTQDIVYQLGMRILIAD